MTLETWFPTPIFYSDAPELIKQNIVQEYFSKEQKVLKILEGDTWGDNVTTTYHAHKNIIETLELDCLKNYILSAAQEFYKYLFASNKQLKIDNSWANYFYLGQYQDRHTHLPNPCISGVYYIKTNGQDGNYVLHPPEVAMEAMYECRERTNLTLSTVEYAPKEGRIILFPSWVPHSVRANKTDSTRISFSFNIR